MKVGVYIVGGFLRSGRDNISSNLILYGKRRQSHWGSFSGTKQTFYYFKRRLNGHDTMVTESFSFLVGCQMTKEKLWLKETTKSRIRHAGEGGQEGAGAPPGFQLGKQGEQKCPF